MSAPDILSRAGIDTFLACATPPVWAEAICEQVDTLLIDHANCELKAASTALSLIYRYPDHPTIGWQMSRLAREELRHYERVLGVMRTRGIPFRRLSASRYASELLSACDGQEPIRLVDSLIVGAFIEARSCERFCLLTAVMPEGELRTLYSDLLASEARHYGIYLSLAREAAEPADVDVDARVSRLRAHEAALAQAPDTVLRFHSGPLEAAASS